MIHYTQNIGYNNYYKIIIHIFQPLKYFELFIYI